MQSNVKATSILMLICFAAATISTAYTMKVLGVVVAFLVLATGVRAQDGLAEGLPSCGVCIDRTWGQ